MSDIPSGVWTAVADRLPCRNETEDLYFWCWHEGMGAPTLLELYGDEKQGGPGKGFCSEGAGPWPEVTHWMPVKAPEPPKA